MNTMISQVVNKLVTYKDRAIMKAVNWALQFCSRPKFEEMAWAVASYSILVFHPLADGQPDFTRPIPEMSSYDVPNLVVDFGRQQVLKFVLNITTPSALVAGFPYLGVGSSVAAVAHTQASLLAELVGNANRKTLLNSSNASFTDSDIVAEISGSFFWKVIAQATYAAGDGNNGSVFGEFGIFNSAVFATVNMYNRILNPSPFTKSGSLAVVTQLTLRS